MARAKQKSAATSDMTRAVIYTRYSPGKNQKDISIEGQLRECHAYADRMNYTVVGEYADRHRTGRNGNRADLQRLMQDIESGCIDVVLVWKFDRFYRNRMESAIQRRRLLDHNVKLVSAMENIPDGSGGIIMEGMLDAMAEWYSAQLSENVTRGLYDTALQCKSTGHPPFGYTVDAKTQRYIINPAEADIVRRAFEMYNEGKGLKEIANIFNNEGLKTKTGIPFKVNSFSFMHNEKYIGIYKWQDDIEIRDGLPRIVSDEVFFNVQRKLDINAKAAARGKATVEYFLSTKIFCGKCGKPMCGESALKKGVHYYYYACSEKKRFHNCTKKNVRKDFIEDAVYNAALDMLTEKNISMISNGVEQRAQERSQSKLLLSQLRRQLNECEKTLNNIGAAIAQGIITETTKDLLQQHEAERAAIKQRITQEQIVSKLSIQAENVACWLSSFKNHDRNDINFKRRVFAALVDKVFVYDDHLKIIFNIDGVTAVDVTFADVETASNVSSAVNTAQPTPAVGQYVPIAFVL